VPGKKVGASPTGTSFDTRIENETNGRIGGVGLLIVDCGLKMDRE
jgi:hypothetical protein